MISSGLIYVQLKMEKEEEGDHIEKSMVSNLTKNINTKCHKLNWLEKSLREKQEQQQKTKAHSNLTMKCQKTIIKRILRAGRE